MDKVQVHRHNGSGIYFEHYRYPQGRDELIRYHRGRSPWQPAERGGYTMCYIVENDGAIGGIGIARCSEKDAFCYRIGRTIARGRALKALATAQAEHP